MAIAAAIVADARRRRGTIPVTDPVALRMLRELREDLASRGFTDKED